MKCTGMDKSTDTENLPELMNTMLEIVDKMEEQEVKNHYTKYLPDSESSDGDDDDSAEVPDSSLSGPAPPLTIHSPQLPDGIKSLFAQYIKDSLTVVDALVGMIEAGKAKNIIVMAGAGISTAAGIPDFRTPGTGLYDNLQKFDLPYPEAIFTMDYFRQDPKPFYVLAKELYPGQFTPTLTHFFVKLLADKGLLLRNYTQNIDCLERVTGTDSELIVEAHGSFHTAHCIKKRCNQEYSQEWMEDKIFQDKPPACEKCQSLVKPDITFFGEGLPSRFFELLGNDFGKCDMLIVMGTSLEVQPFASLINSVKDNVPRLLINRERVGEANLVPGVGFDFDGRWNHQFHRDAFMAGNSDEACELLAKKLGWEAELAELQRNHKPSKAEKV